MLSLKTAETMYGFRPALSYWQAEYLLETQFSPKEVKNDAVYRLVKKIAASAYLTYEDEFDKRWTNFYLPLRRSGKLITIPLSIVEYKKAFYVGFHLLGNLAVDKGTEKVEKEYAAIFREVLKFSPVIKKVGNEVIEKTLPYDFRTGKIRGRHVLSKLMQEKEKKRIMNAYAAHVELQDKASGVSLEDYLSVAAACYRAAYGLQATGLTPEQMYRKWADGRDGGMLSIKDKKSRQEFSEWYRLRAWAGAHPFEIVFSWHEHGIHLYPPSTDYPYYALRVTNYAYAPDFVKMVEALADGRVPFTAADLEKVLEYLAGETYFTVNDYDKHYIRYYPCKEDKEKYFKHVEWDEVRVVKWR